jgi:hypothetical protein
MRYIRGELTPAKRTECWREGDELSQVPGMLKVGEGHRYLARFVTTLYFRLSITPLTGWYWTQQKMCLCLSTTRCCRSLGAKH